MLNQYSTTHRILCIKSQQKETTNNVCDARCHCVTSLSFLFFCIISSSLFFLQSTKFSAASTFSIFLHQVCQFSFPASHCLLCVCVWSRKGSKTLLFGSISTSKLMERNERERERKGGRGHFCSLLHSSANLYICN